MDVTFRVHWGSRLSDRSAELLQGFPDSSRSVTLNPSRVTGVCQASESWCFFLWESQNIAV